MCRRGVPGFGASAAAVFRCSGRGAALRPGCGPRTYRAVLVESAAAKTGTGTGRGPFGADHPSCAVEPGRCGVSAGCAADPGARGSGGDLGAARGFVGAESAVGIVDASYDSMPLILHELRRLYPELEVHQVEAGVPEQ